MTAVRVVSKNAKVRLSVEKFRQLKETIEMKETQCQIN